MRVAEYIRQLHTILDGTYIYNINMYYYTVGYFKL